MGAETRKRTILPGDLALGGLEESVAAGLVELEQGSRGRSGRCESLGNSLHVEVVCVQGKCARVCALSGLR